MRLHADASRRELLSVVVPIYNESDVIPELWERTRRTLESLEGVAWEILFVDDGSTDGSYARLAEIAERDPRACVLKLSRNFGHQIAITAGIDRARGDGVVIIDGDLQDPPEVIPEMVAKWREGYDVVYGVRRSRSGETPMKLLTARIFYRVIRTMTRIDIPANVGDFRLLSRRAVNELNKLREKDRFVRGLVSWIGFRQIGVPYERHKRFAGSTKYPYRTMIRFALDGITSFSAAPLKLATWLGYLASFAAFLYLASVFVQKALGYTVQGWATIMVAILFLGGVQLISLGIIGEYVGRMFNETKNRPVYVLEEVLGGQLSAEPSPHVCDHCGREIETAEAVR